ncbi:MAG: sugar porter family MFS transporter [Phycisphaerales bacterium JB063]
MASTGSLVLRSSIIAALGGLLFGFDTVVISGGIGDIVEEYGLSSAQEGFTVASALIGTIIGAMCVGKPTDWYGRRPVMMLLAVLFTVSAIGCAFAWDWWSLLGFRLIGGLGIGGASVVSPMYICEIAPASRRGRLGMLAQFNIVLGILVAFVSNYIVASIGFGENTWRWMLGVETLPALAYLLLLFWVPESPRWLVARGRDDEARGVIERVGTDQGRSVVEEVLAIEQSLATERAGLREPFFQRRYLKPIMLAFAIAAFNQLSGINAILYYATRIFESAGFGESAALLNGVGLGLVNLIFTMSAMFFIDRFGRKSLMLVGSFGYIVTLAATAVVFFTQTEMVANGQGEMVRRITSSSGGMVVFVALCLFIAAHAFGQGAVLWVFISEVFPNAVRARGLALGSWTHWVFAAAIGQSFPMIADRAGGWVFAFYAVCMLGQLVWVLLVMPETRNVPLEEIGENLGIGGPGTDTPA